MKEKSFTIMELLIVMAIILTLSAITIPIAYNAQKGSLIHRARADIKKLELAIEMYKADLNLDITSNNLSWITTWLTGVKQDGSLLTIAYAGETYNIRGEFTWRGPYLDIYSIDRDTSGNLVDPWGRAYGIIIKNPRYNTASYDIYSAGPDRVFDKSRPGLDGSTGDRNGDGIDDDVDNIINWEETNKNEKNGFTILEIMMVLTIITVLMAILIPTLTSVKNQAKKTKAEATIRAITMAMESYRNDFGCYPLTLHVSGIRNSWDSDEDCEEFYRLLVNRHYITITKQYLGPYMEPRDYMIGDVDNDGNLQFVDPWGNNYIIFGDIDSDVSTRPPFHNVYTFDIYSLGPDKTSSDKLTFNGGNEDDDINNWN